MTTNESVVTAAGVTVRYGRKTAVDDVTLDVPRGSVYALLGRNGAGKSSLVRCLVGMRKPEGGTIRLLGEDVWTRRAALMERVGVVAEEGDAPPEMKVGAIAAFCRRLHSRWDDAAFAERLRRFGIDPRARFGDLSKGEKKQVALALALAPSPELIVLDDPTLGLDVVARRALFEEVIAELADRGTTVVITTHDLAGVEAIADRVAIFSKGRLLLAEETETLKARFRRIRTAAAPAALAGAGLPTASIRSWGSGAEAVVTNYDEQAVAGIGPVEATPMSLEEIFIAVAGEEGGIRG